MNTQSTHLVQGKFHIFMEYFFNENRDLWSIKSTDVEINEERSLGKGAFSEVFLGVLSGKNCIVAKVDEIINLGKPPLFQINQSIEVQLNLSKSKNICEVGIFL